MSTHLLFRPPALRGIVCTILLGGALTACDEEAGEGGVIRISGDMLGANTKLVISDSIPGDAILAAGDIGFDGMTGGDLIAAGGELLLSGRTGGSVRAAGENVVVSTAVTRNVMLAGRQVELSDAASVGGNAYLAGATVKSTGSIVGGVLAGAGIVVLDGPIGGDVRVEAERLEIGPRARIQGNLRYRVPPENVLIDPSAVIGGERTALPPRPDSRLPGLFKAIWLLGFLGAGAVVVLLFPKTMAAAADTFGVRPLPSAGIGVLWIVGIPISIVLVAISVIGIPLAFIAGCVYAISLYLGRTIAAVWLGKLILRQRSEPLAGRVLLNFFVGGAALLAVGFVPILGTIVGLLATVLGLGAFVLALRPGWTPES